MPLLVVKKYISINNNNFYLSETLMNKGFYSIALFIFLLIKPFKCYNFLYNEGVNLCT